MNRRILVGTALLAACASSPASEASLTPAIPIPGQPSIPYPEELFNSGVEGEVLLYLVVDSAGHVLRDSTRIAKSSGKTEFDAAALDAAPGLRFTPAEKNGERVMSPIQVPIRFSIPDSVRRMTSKPHE